MPPLGSSYAVRGFRPYKTTPEQKAADFKHAYGNPIGLSDESQSAKEKRENLNRQGAAAAGFAGTGEQGYGALTAESAAARDRMRQLAEGKDSLSAEQL